LSEVLDIGCGRAKTPGAFGIDIVAAPGVDLVHDLNRIPWPLEENRFGEVVCSHVLEHVADVAAVLNEIHRVSRPGARVQVVTSHFSSLNSWEDPGHLHHFSRRSFTFFDPANKHCCGGRHLKVISVGVSFGGGLFDQAARFAHWCSPDFWEKQLCFILRGRNLFAELEVQK